MRNDIQRVFDLSLSETFDRVYEDDDLITEEVRMIAREMFIAGIFAVIENKTDGMLEFLRK